MTEYEDIMQRLEEMRTRFKSGFSPSDRSLLESLNYRLFQKIITQTGCSDCYRDAYIIIYNRLKSDKQMPKEANYILKNGILLHEFGTSEYYAKSVTDEVAEYFLKKNPEDIRLFQKYPSDWKERINKTSETKEEVKPTQEAPKVSADEEPSLFGNEVEPSTEEEINNKKRQSRKRK